MNLKRTVRRAFIGLLRRLPPDKTLRLLFRLDRWLYYLQGQVAGFYGGGVHPKHRHMKYHDFFVERITVDDLVLDVGCGIGAVAYSIASRTGASVLGIDIHVARIEQAKTNYAHSQLEFWVGDVLQLIPERPFTVIVLSNVLEHLPDRPQFLRRVHEVTGADKFLIRVPLFERDWRVPLKKELGVEWRLDPTHEIEYTLAEFDQEMAEAHLAIVERQVRWGEIWCHLQTIPSDA